MRVIAVDDEPIILDDFVDMLDSMDEISVAKGFTDYSLALAYINKYPVDAAFLDIKMRGMDGITLAGKIKDINPDINIIFLTAYSEYSIDAFKLHASGYLLKPVNEEDVRKELLELRIPVKRTGNRRFDVRCFGNFEVYIDGKPCIFKYSKTKELVAYLVDRKGAFCSNGEILATLWEDVEVTDSLENYLRNLISDLRGVLKKHGCEDIVIKKKGEIAIVTDAILCDYYEYLQGKSEGISLYGGEYMTQYSWAETTLAWIENNR